MEAICATPRHVQDLAQARRFQIRRARGQQIAIADHLAVDGRLARRRGDDGAKTLQLSFAARSMWMPSAVRFASECGEMRMRDPARKTWPKGKTSTLSSVGSPGVRSESIGSSIRNRSPASRSMTEADGGAAGSWASPAGARQRAEPGSRRLNLG